MKKMAEEKIRGVPYGSAELPVFGEADVVIAGAGPGGLGAALAAAWQGAKVLVAEEYGVAGGMAAIAEVHPFMRNHAGAVCNDAPVYGQWKKAMEPYLPDGLLEKIADPNDYSCYSINKSAAALAAEITGVRKNLLYQQALERHKTMD